MQTNKIDENILHDDDWTRYDIWSRILTKNKILTKQQTQHAKNEWNSDGNFDNDIWGAMLPNQESTCAKIECNTTENVEMEQNVGLLGNNTLKKNEWSRDENVEMDVW